jgi:hypothetical protein
MELAKVIEIDGRKFQLHLMDPWDSIGLDVEVAQLCAPMGELLTDLKKAGATEQENPAGESKSPAGTAVEGQEPGELTDEELETLFTAFSKLLQGLKPDTFADLLKRLIGGVEYIASKGPSFALIDATPLQRKQIFGQNMIIMYRLMLEVARFNKFLPFALSDIGSLIGGTSGSPEQKKSKPRRGLKLAGSGGRLPA